MALLTSSEVSERLRAGWRVDNLDTDDDGEVIIYTGVYRWKNGEYHDCEETNDVEDDRNESELAHTD